MDNAALLAKVVILTYISVLQWLFVCLFFSKNLHVLFYMALLLRIIFNKKKHEVVFSNLKYLFCLTSGGGWGEGGRDALFSSYF